MSVHVMVNSLLRLIPFALVFHTSHAVCQPNTVELCKRMQSIISSGRLHQYAVPPETSYKKSVQISKYHVDIDDDAEWDVIRITCPQQGKCTVSVSVTKARDFDIRLPPDLGVFKDHKGFIYVIRGIFYTEEQKISAVNASIYLVTDFDVIKICKR